MNTQYDEQGEKDVCTEIIIEKAKLYVCTCAKILCRALLIKCHIQCFLQVGLKN